MHVAYARLAAVSVLTLVFALSLTGCEQKEKVLDIEGPNGKLEIERSTQTGKIDIEIDRDK